jgi:hypothetical protein
MEYYGTKGGVSMKRLVFIGIIIAFTLAVVGFKGSVSISMDILEVGLNPPIFF